MAKENIVNSSLRFNLENEQHLCMYQYVYKMDVMCMGQGISW